ncbi:hypothetical protein HS088_TW21G01724 [Tripterygium wilfordii]|uniref:Membrane-associated kinase regulator 4 n=1 Tax=Tripterygium wilfordii TaxID=458696 RepID=A0A7J7C6S4_TRIWF|nr:probable membrane-associated kinase regulator 4 [Tripterygium wilfordii]KAF5729557.1 hypothetical protein HS088_TW21G01724 [Tripterygium wilfordii]
MAVNLVTYDHAEDDYIDMEVDSFCNFHGHSISSPPHQRDFEFHMSSLSLEREHTTSPADELFYKGKLLPLHLPPRLQMVEKFLQNPSPAYATRKEDFKEIYSTPLVTTAATPSSTSTPFESCNISPFESCQVSRELKPEEYFSQYTTDVSVFINENAKKSWIKKLKLVKQSSLGSKLKASQAYLKSLFGKSSCSDESCAAATKVADEISASKAKESLKKYVKATKKNPFGHIQRERYQLYSTRDKGKIIENSVGRHRRSFSMAIRRHSTNKSSSSSSSSSSGSSSSSSSNNTNQMHIRPYLKRSTSMNSEIENSIQGAIAHCKQSQQSFHPKQISSEITVHTLSASRIAVCEDHERPDLCRV